MALDSIVRGELFGALGLGKDSGAVEKLTIFYETKAGTEGKGKGEGEVKALFNPNQLTISNTVQWEPRKSALPELGSSLDFTGASNQPATLELDLFFDTYGGNRKEQSIGQSLAENLTTTPLALAPGASPSRASVTDYTDAIVRLLRVDQELHRPPICRLVWGRFQIFRGVLMSLTEKFTLFHSDGTPARAVLSCRFLQYQNWEETYKAIDLHSADVAKTYVVRRGDTLSSIAAAVYSDPLQWRPIAAANGIQNPRSLSPGQVLRIPKLK